VAPSCMAGQSTLSGQHRNSKPASKQPEAPLGLHASAKLRERLIAEIRSLRSPDDAAEWVRQSLPEKGRLRASDAAQVEAGFGHRLRLLSSTAAAEAQRADAVGREASAEAGLPSEDFRRPPHSKPVDKSVLALPEPRRIRDRDHVRFVAAQPCLVCGRLPSDPHHLRFAQNRALSRKVSDEFAVPLCRGHHRELHRCGDEAGWWGHLGINVLEVARALWLESHPLPITLEVTPRNLASDRDEAREAVASGQTSDDAQLPGGRTT
jgi:hypothetical protein